jgi:hypothetical protein
MADQARGKTPGVPGTNDGSWKAHENGESDVSLSEYDGSFLYPPYFESPEEVIEFWSNVEIPDEVLANAQSLYADNRRVIQRDWPMDSWRKYGSPMFKMDHPVPGEQSPEYASWVKAHDDVSYAYEERLQRTAGQAESLDRRDVRALVRSVAMVRSAITDLPREEFHAVAAHRVRLKDGEKGVFDAANDSGLLMYHEDVLDPASKKNLARADVEAIVKKVVDDAIAKQNESLDNVFDELTDNLSKVGQVVIDMNDPDFVKRQKREKRGY